MRIFFFVVLVTPLFAMALSERHIKQISEHLTPAAKVCLQGKSCAAVIPTYTGSARSGEVVYNTSCASCHASGVSGAPVLGDNGLWESRLAKGVSALYQSVINGLGVMPPRGACIDCSDDELRNAVDYMTKDLL